MHIYFCQDYLHTAFFRPHLRKGSQEITDTVEEGSEESMLPIAIWALRKSVQLPSTVSHISSPQCVIVTAENNNHFIAHLNIKDITQL